MAEYVHVVVLGPLMSAHRANSANVEFHGVLEKPLGSDLLAGIDTITALGGIYITQTGAVRSCGKETFASIHSNQHEFSVGRNHQQRSRLQYGSEQQVWCHFSYATGC